MLKKRVAYFQEFKGRACEWIHMSHVGAAELRELGLKYGFHEHDLRDVLPTLQHTKCIVRPQYIFLVLIFPIYDREKGVISETELDIFVNSTSLVTVNHGNKLREVTDLLAEMTHAARRELILSQTPAEAVVNLVDSIYKSVYPILVHLSHDINAAEHKLFAEYNKESTIKDILMLKTSNNHARKAMLNHKNTLTAFRAALPTFFEIVPAHEHLNNIMNRTTDIWNTLESHRETIESLHRTHESLLSYRTNQIMKTLTIFSVIVFPLTLIAAIFAMRTEGMPFIGHPYSFWMVLGLMVAATLAMLGIFKTKKWL